MAIARSSSMPSTLGLGCPKSRPCLTPLRLPCTLSYAASRCYTSTICPASTPPSLYHVPSSGFSIPFKGLFRRQNPGDSSRSAKKPPSLHEIEEQYRQFLACVRNSDALLLMVMQTNNMAGAANSREAFKRLKESAFKMSPEEIDAGYADVGMVLRATKHAGEAAWICKGMCDEFIQENEANPARMIELKRKGKGGSAAHTNELAFQACERVWRIRTHVLPPAWYYTVVKTWKLVLGGTVVAVIAGFYWRTQKSDGTGDG